MSTATTGEASISIDAPADLVYAVLSDVTRLGERSPECKRCEWLDGATGPSVGARFRGHNRLGLLRWSTTCVVTEADPGRVFAFTVVSGHGRPETEWRYEISATDRPTTVTESYRFLWCPWLARVAETPFPRDKQLRRGIRETLSAIKSTAEAMTAGLTQPSG
jgi:hypothetical protein